jgi:hypothetical protein
MSAITAIDLDVVALEKEDYFQFPRCNKCGIFPRKFHRFFQIFPRCAIKLRGTPIFGSSGE